MGIRGSDARSGRWGTFGATTPFEGSRVVERPGTILPGQIPCRKRWSVSLSFIEFAHNRYQNKYVMINKVEGKKAKSFRDLQKKLPFFPSTGIHE